MSTTALYADLPARLEAAADNARDCYTAWQNSLKTRNRLIVAAVDDAGMSQGQVSKHTKIGQPSINRILGTFDDTDAAQLEQDPAA